MSADQKRAFLAVVFSGIILFGWQYFFAPNVDHRSMTNSDASQGLSSSFSGSSSLSEKQENVKTKNLEDGPSKLERSGSLEVSHERGKIVTAEGEDGALELDSHLGLLSIKNNSSKFSFLQTVGAKEKGTPLEIQFLTDKGYESLPFVFSESEGAAQVHGENKEKGIRFIGKFEKGDKFHFTIDSTRKTRIRFLLRSSPKESENRLAREFLIFTKDVQRIRVGEKEYGEGKLKWMGIDFNYHLFATVLTNHPPFNFRSYENGSIVFESLFAVESLKGYFLFTKKKYSALVEDGDNLKLSVDFGILGILAVPILKGLEFFYSFIPNYGIAIIFLTLLLRLITFPLQYKSFVSMKKMQVVQPELAKLREKFKDDPQRMQKESMDLFKRAGANPLSGCLPLILQMPLFFAFYKVLNNSVELVGSPFIFWIHDLSVKDPFYVLPILMTLTMFLQQKLTPATSADPNQQKIMMFMPIVFGFIMKDLPAGLTLYIFFSTLCGILQQVFVFKKKS